MEPLAVAVFYSGVPIRLTHERWVHIVDAHDYMAGNLDLVLETLGDPDSIASGSEGALIALKRHKETNLSRKWVVVVYRENEEGFVITAFMTSKEEKILRKGVVWKK